jgi:hypothetical protein
MALYRVPCMRMMRTLSSLAGELRRLMAEMAYGYKHLVNESLARPDWLHQRKQLSQALYFAAKYLSLELFLAFESYQYGISAAWNEILIMYRLAEQQNLHHEGVEDRDQSDPGSATISHVFKRITLLRLLDPYHLVPGEARACFEYLNLWASSAVLENLQQMGNPAGRFLLDMEGREPLRPPDPDILPRSADRFRYLNLLPLSRQMQHQLHQQALHEVPLPEGLQQHLHGLDPIQVLRRMLHAWHGRRERRNERRETFGWVWCGCGLDALSQSPRGEDGGVGDSMPSEAGGQGQTTVARIQPAPSRWIRCRQVNRSDGGVWIRLQLPAEIGPHVGQALLLQEELAGGRGDRRAGIVRWKRVDVDTQEIGIQFVPGIVRPILLRPHSSRDFDFQPALLVDQGHSRTNSVFTKQGLYRRGQQLILMGGQLTRVVKLSQLLESTPSFDRFRVQGD